MPASEMAPTDKGFKEKMSQAYAMKAGDGPNSYANNSTFQKRAVDSAREVIREEIAAKLDTHTLSLSSSTFHIADLGCSVGPNTFFAVENLLEAVQVKYQTQGPSSQTPEFQVFFNDHSGNDFNMLFKSLPQNRNYYAVGVPGSFYGRLFPKASINLFHSSYSLSWLSRVPKEILDKESPAWNKGKIHYSNSTSPGEVIRAYEAQNADDMECFLSARAQEIVYGGLMMLIIICRPNGTPHFDTLATVTYETLGSCLVDMTKEGKVSEEKIDSFNIPIYFMSPEEVEVAVDRNGNFNIERIQILPNVLTSTTLSNASISTSHLRAVMEALLEEHFGDEILDELFNLYHKKVAEQPSKFGSGKAIVSLFVLKRKAN
ncbi:unnamed protein product [Malus baccata var. baccata]